MCKYTELIEELIVNKNRNEKDEFLNDLYILIHLANGRCKNKHEDWKKQIEDKYFLNK